MVLHPPRRTHRFLSDQLIITGNLINPIIGDSDDHALDGYSRRHLFHRLCMHVHGWELGWIVLKGLVFGLHPMACMVCSIDGLHRQMECPDDRSRLEVREQFSPLRGHAYGETTMDPKTRTGSFCALRSLETLLVEK